VKICFRRHGEWNRGTGDLTPQAQLAALRKARDYDQVYSSPVWRCIQTARVLSNGGDVQTCEIFTDLGGSVVGVWDHVDSIRNFLRQFVGSEGKVLIVSHSNLVSALNLLNLGEEIPKDLNDLPEFPYLGGFNFYV